LSFSLVTFFWLKPKESNPPEAAAVAAYYKIMILKMPVLFRALVNKQIKISAEKHIFVLKTRIL
jgi:hypothetical protein